MISRLTATATVFAIVATALIVLAANAAVRTEGAQSVHKEVVQLPLVEIVATRARS